MRITKREYDAFGGMRNPRLYRRQHRSGRWQHYAAEGAKDWAR
jgi:hypothetical protein